MVLCIYIVCVCYLILYYANILLGVLFVVQGESTLVLLDCSVAKL